MSDEDRDALAAEYVLGTLSAEERDQAETLLAQDAGFAESVRLWEHRLGELNVMVEAVEPAPDLWERIKTGIDGTDRRSQAPAEALALNGVPSEPADAAAASVSPLLDGSAEPNFQALPDLLSEPTQASDVTKSGDLASALLPSGAAEFEDRSPKPAPTQAAPEAQAVAVDGNLGRWRALAIAASAIAVLLAAYVAIAQFAPKLAPRQPQATAIAARPAAVPQLVAVLQQEPTSPAFLVALDPQQRSITIRRLTAAPDSGRSYELWLTSNQLPKPVSLGAIGNNESTTRAVPQTIDIEAMRNATYSVSLEPEGGSTTGAPTGPTLFRGRMIEAVPGSSG